MAINTFSGIKAEISNWLARSDLDSSYDTIVGIGESRLARDLRIREMESQLSETMVSGQIAVPSDFLELKNSRIEVSGGTAKLENKEGNWILDKYQDRANPKSRPHYIGIDGGYFIFGPLPDQDYTVKGVYYAKPAVLTDVAPTNVWTINTSDALFFSCLTAAASFVQDDRLASWNAAYLEIVRSYNSAYKKQNFRNTRVSYE